MPQTTNVPRAHVLVVSVVTVAVPADAILAMARTLALQTEAVPPCSWGVTHAIIAVIKAVVAVAKMDRVTVLVHVVIMPMVLNVRQRLARTAMRSGPGHAVAVRVFSPHRWTVASTPVMGRALLVTGRVLTMGSVMARLAPGATTTSVRIRSEWARVVPPLLSVQMGSVQMDTVVTQGAQAHVRLATVFIPVFRMVPVGLSPEIQIPTGSARIKAWRAVGKTVTAMG